MANKPTAHREWTKLIRFDQSTLNTSRDGADIGDLELQACQNFIFDNGVLEKASGMTKVNASPLESGAPIMGVFRSHDTYGNKSLLAMCNGKLKRWTGSSFGNVEENLSASARSDFLNWKDSTIMVNGVDEAREFTPRTNGIKKFGLEPPRFYKKIAYFESDETIVHGGNGTTDTTFVKKTERTGKSKTSLKLTADAGETDTSYVSYASAQDFATFPNGATILDTDMLCLDILHRELAYVDEIYVDFWTAAGSYYRITIDGSELDPIDQQDNRWTTITTKISRYTTVGSPDWYNINRVYFSLKAQTGTTSIYIDNVYFKNTPIEVIPYALIIDSYEGFTTDYTVTSGTIGSEYFQKKHDAKSLRARTQEAPASFYREYDPTLNLNQYADGAASPASDEISIWVLYLSELTSLALKFTGATGDLTYTWSAAAGDFPPTAGYWIWRHVTAKKSAFSGTQSNWETVSKITYTITTEAACADVYIDRLALEQGQYVRVLSDMESDETWVFYGNGGANTDKTKLSEGVQSIYLSVPCRAAFTATRNVTATDLTYFNAVSETSTTADYISVWCYWTMFNYIKSIKLQIDCNADDYTTDLFEYEWTKDSIRLALQKDNLDLRDLNNRTLTLEAKKSDFTRIGDTDGKGWGTVQGYRFIVETPLETDFSLLVYFDNLVMRRGKGLSGLYQWCCVFESPTAFSAPSEWSDVTELNGESAFVTNIPISQDSDVMARHIFRRGGSWGDEARLDFTLYDNTTTAYPTSNQDNVLGRTLAGIDIPDGTIRVPIAAKWGPIFKGSALLYRDPEDLKRVHFSNPRYLYAWSEKQRLIMDSDVQNVFLEDSVLYISCKNGTRRILIPLDEVGPKDIEEVGDSKPAISPYATCKAEQLTALVSYDGPYLFDGQSYQYIGDLIDTYFSESVYDLDEALVFYADQHLYISVKPITGARTLLDAAGPPIQWRTSDAAINCFCVFDGIGDNGEVYMGDSTGTVWQFGSGYATAATVTTKDFGAGGEESDLFNEIILTNVLVIAKSISATPGPVAITLRKNQADVAGITLYASSDKTISGNLASVYTVYRFDLRGNYDEQRGVTIGLKLTHSSAKHCAIQAIKLEGEITPLLTYDE